MERAGLREVVEVQGGLRVGGEGFEWGVRRRDREREIQVGDMNRDKWERWRDARKDGIGGSIAQNGVPSGLKEVVKDMIKKLAYATTRKHP